MKKSHYFLHIRIFFCTFAADFEIHAIINEKHIILFIYFTHNGKEEKSLHLR